jgi:hypothetical protein
MPKFGEPGFNYGEANPSFKGDEVKYEALHIYVRRRKPMPDLCEFCGLVPPVDLANKSGKYLRDLDDWNYLCRKCHMDSDGRNDRLRESGRSRKIPNGICLECGKSFERLRREAKFCSRQCFSKNRIIFMICLNCGVTFKPKVMKRNTAKFCSRRCSATFIWAQRKAEQLCVPS